MKNYSIAGQAMDNKIRRVRIAYKIRKIANTHSKYLLLITFPLQRSLHERASCSRCAYIVVFLLNYITVCVRAVILGILSICLQISAD